MATATTDKKPRETTQAKSLHTFTVEFGDDAGRNIMISALQLTMRGAWDRQRMASRKDSNGRPLGVRTMSDHMNRMPDIPGQRMEVDTKKLTVRIFDPLVGDELSYAGSVLDDALLMSGKREYIPQPEVVHDLQRNEDTFKTLMVELQYKLANGMARIVDGAFPANADLHALPGRQLHDPGNSSPKCRYEEDYPEYVKTLDRR